MARKIVVTGGKGGVGKTTVCANLGIALAHKSKRVLLMDLDIGLNNLDVTMHVEDKVVFDLVDVIENRCRPSQAFIQDSAEPTLYVMPSCHLAKRQINADQIKRVVSRLEDNFDYIFIDCPAGIDSGFRRAVACADEAILVVTPHLSSVRDADKAIAELIGNTPVSVVINRVRGDLVASGEMLSPFEVFSLLGQTALGVLPENDYVNCNVRGSRVAAFDLLASNLETGKCELYDCVTPYKGVFGRLRRKLKRNA